MNGVALDFVLILAGAALLFFGAEWLVSGAAGLARCFGISPLVIGLTVVAFGTSAPELVVSVIASLGGQGSLAVGNVVGSNIANLGLILGVTALLSRLRLDGGLIRREVPALVVSTLLLPLLLLDGVVSRLEGGVLLSLAIALSLLLIRSPSAETIDRESELVDHVASQALSPAKDRLHLAGLSLLGLVVLVMGGRILVGAAASLALGLGMSERMVGLTIVAVGTSLPELAASMVAAVRGHAAMAVGNILGSNVLNVLLVLGGASLARAVAAPLQDFGADLIVLAPFTAFTAFVLRRKRVTRRWEGFVLALGYGAYILSLVLRAG